MSHSSRMVLAKYITHMYSIFASSRYCYVTATVNLAKHTLVDSKVGNKDTVIIRCLYSRSTTQNHFFVIRIVALRAPT